jgi:hypothetical protein
MHVNYGPNMDLQGFMFVRASHGLITKPCTDGHAKTTNGHTLVWYCLDIFNGRVCGLGSTDLYAEFG